jgi:uncharacterized membrane protein YtjA (UPF0391 family)
MLLMSIVFLVIALITGLFGFMGVASGSWEGARIFSFIFLAMAVLAFLAHWYYSRAARLQRE